MKKYLIGSLLAAIGLWASVAYAAPLFNYVRSQIPEQDSTYTSGTTTKAWLSVISDEFCLTGDSCIAQWPAGGPGGSSTTTIAGLTPTNGVFIFATGTAQGIGLTISTTSPRTITFTPTVSSGYVIPLSASTTEWSNLYTNLFTRLVVSTSSTGTLFYVSTSTPGTLNINYPANVLSTTTAAATYEPILTKGNLTASSPLQFDNTRQVIGGAAAISVASGYAIPTTASSTGWDTAYTLRHAAVTLAGENYLSLSGQQITAGAITLSGTNVTGVLPISKGGTGTSTAPAASALLVGNGTGFDYTTLPSCSDATNSKLLYNTSTKTFTCGTDQSGGGGSLSGGTVGFVTTWASSTGVTIGTLRDNGTVAGAGATSSTISFLVQGTGTLNPFQVNSSTGTSLLSVAVNGSTTLSSLGTGLVRSSSGALYTDTTSYLTQAAADSSYVSFSYASSTFHTFAYASSTFPTFNYASSTFPTFAYASSSYFTLFNTVAGSNIVITTSTALKTIAVTSTPTFTSVTTTNASTTGGLTTAALWFSDSGLLSQNCLGTGSDGKVAGTTCGLSGGNPGKLAVWSGASSLGKSIIYDASLGGGPSVAGVNATSSTVTFNVQGSGSNAAFNVASSTGTSLFQITASAQVLVCTTCRLTIPQGTAPTLSAAGDIAQDTTVDQLLYGSQPNVLQATSTKSITWESPTASDNITFWRTDVPITITKASCIQTSSVNNPSTTVNIRHFTDRSTTTGNTLLASSAACTATTTTQSLTTNGDTTIAAGEWVWVITSATSNSSSTNITLEFKYDRQ